MEHLPRVWQMPGRNRICFPRKEQCEESLPCRVEMVSVGVSTEPCQARWEVETDEIVLQRRQKQIDYGKRTPGYQCFLQQVPKRKNIGELGRHNDSQDFILKRQTKTGGIAAAPGMPRSGNGEKHYIPGIPPASLCRASEGEGQGMETPLLEPMDSTPLDDLLDDWLQTLEP
ncbi:hypothetical protein QTO34_016116 [Cnephaeus nilssonii]|uniref:Histone RNA hairpin-binding protein RNA-binding domain-containing protein n=1 Tax=Cnephaeus nilssonii TaxID=3371016 RepID=A0AA40LTI6_CNENI|nr:hypothetical protein QTO34_016116 [Eptesicus nilssonii]